MTKRAKIGIISDAVETTDASITTVAGHTSLYVSIVIIYVLAMLGIGYWCMKKTHNVGDFFLGGRSLGPWMSAFAYGTSYFSAVIFIGYAGKLGWGFGVQTLWIVVGNTLIGTSLAWLILAGRTREMTSRLNAITMPEFLAARYESKLLQVFSGIAIFALLVPYSASVYMGLSYLFEKTMGLQYGEALVFLAVLTGVYLVMGGYFAVVVSDFVRGIVEFAGVMLMVAMLIEMKGGFSSTFHQLLQPVNMPDLFNPDGVLKGAAESGGLFPGWMILLCLVFITSFGPWSLPQMVQKFFYCRRFISVPFFWSILYRGINSSVFPKSGRFKSYSCCRRKIEFGYFDSAFYCDICAGMVSFNYSVVSFFCINVQFILFGFSIQFCNCN